VADPKKPSAAAVKAAYEALASTHDPITQVALALDAFAEAERERVADALDAEASTDEQNARGAALRGEASLARTVSGEAKHKRSLAARIRARGTQGGEG
jgi:hypothetical protein